MNLEEKAETRAPELRLDQREKTKQKSLKSEGGPGFRPTPGQKQGTDPGREGQGNFLCVSQMDRSTEGFNSRTTVDPKTGGVSPASGFRTILGVGSQSL